MQRLGFIHDMLDVKVLILFVMSRASYPATSQQIYELCYQDDCVSYFDVCTAIPQMVKSGHLTEKEPDLYEITEKGRADGSLTQDSIAYTVRCRAENAVNRFNRQLRRSSFVKTSVEQREGGDYTVKLSLNDEVSDLLKMELMAPTQKHAYRLAAAFSENAETIYRLIMDQLLTQPKDDT